MSEQHWVLDDVRGANEDHRGETSWRVSDGILHVTFVPNTRSGVDFVELHYQLVRVEQAWKEVQA